MITVTKDSAELLAQVFPTLLIVLAIEARGGKDQFKTFWGLVRFNVRVTAIVMSLVSTFLCINVAARGTGGSAVDWCVNIAFWSMFVALLLFINDMLSREIDES